MSPLPLLKLLADGKFHSGEELGGALRLSRAAIWKQIHALPELGLRVDAVRGRGYRIVGGLDLLDAERIAAALRVALPHRRLTIDVFDIVDSTNSVARSRARAGARRDYACIAEQQTAGRGRRGRRWASPFGNNIYISFVHEFSGGFAAIEGLSLAVGVSVCESIEALGLDGVGLKWPNDLVVDGRKLGGILIEVAGDVGGVCQAVIGVGINVSMADDEAELVDQPWTDMCRIGFPRGRRNDVAVSLLGNLFGCVEEFDRDGLASFLPRWQRFDVLVGKRVDVVCGQQVVSGIVDGIDPAGALVLATNEGSRFFRSGEVSVRNWH